jgi:hypothetical protein
MSNAENPAKTGNKTVDFAIGKIPIIKNGIRVLILVK